MCIFANGCTSSRATEKNNEEFKEVNRKIPGNYAEVTPKKDGKKNVASKKAEEIRAEQAVSGRIISISDKSYSEKLKKKSEKIYPNFLEAIAALTNELEQKDEIINMLKAKQSQLEQEREDMLFDLGKLSVESDFKMNTSRDPAQFQRIFLQKPLKSLVGNVKQSCLSVLSTSRQLSVESDKESVAGKSTGSDSGQYTGSETASQDSANNVVNPANDTNSPPENLQFSVEVTERSDAEPVNLSSKPSSLVTASVYNVYKLLLLTVSHVLLSSEIAKLKEWASEMFSIQTNLAVTEVILQLDQDRRISASDLSHLRVFFEKIFRYDLVCLIDEFYKGEYSKLWNMVRENKASFTLIEKRNQPYYWSTANDNMLATLRVSPRPTTGHQDERSIQLLKRPRTTEQNDAMSVPRNQQRTENFSASGSHRKTASDLEVINTPGDEQRIGANNSSMKSKQPASQGLNTEKLPAHRHKPSLRQRDGHSCASHSSDRQARDAWLCNHYKRKCFVKFECCDQYWPCHRCHNNDSTCGNRKLKSRNTSMVKCVKCHTEQEFGQFCVTCNTQFSTFFCGLCKHLTGRDDHPYHCDKCGICRINGDRSFHCDVCGVCLDVQLRGNHKCRPYSAHDECCICLEDAFTGCQILPCSHKVHKECATRMIKSGITRCPICRESFAHKLERRTPSKKTTKRR